MGEDNVRRGRLLHDPRRLQSLQGTSPPPRSSRLSLFAHPQQGVPLGS